MDTALPAERSPRRFACALAAWVVCLACAEGGEAPQGGAGPTDGSSGTGFDASGGSSSGGLGGSGGGGAIGALGGSGGSGAVDAPPDTPLGDAPSDAIDTDADASDGDNDAGTCVSNIERCNGLDDDCQNGVDDGNPGGGAVCAVAGGIGVCAQGKRECVAASLKCVANVSSDEICDGLDNDCDGDFDEDDPGGGQPCNSGLKGICAAGTTHCVNGQLECPADSQPQTEVCNGDDDDCDGIPDNGFAGAGEPCTVTGQIAGTPCADGLTNCLGGANGCAQTYVASSETCDGEDNDCDGVNDNSSELENKACDTGLSGVCAAGKTHCDYAADQGLTCVPDVAPTTQAEICDDADNDCNGQTDDIADLGLECGAIYPSAQHVAVWACTQAACVIVTCATGYKDCNGTPGDGCEIDTRTSAQNCGACGAACSSANGTASCSAGACSIACNAGFDNCDNDARTNGCELNVNTSVQNCGSCAAICSSSNGTATCGNGTCGITCNSGFLNCDNDAKTNGCEININTSLQNCGSCGSACSSSNGTANCSSGNCTINCNSGFGNCDNNARSNGCEANFATSTANCGSCGAGCSSANGTATCSNSTCSITCNSGFSDCDNNARSNGCEVNLKTDAAHCGTCTTVCSGLPCTAGVCCTAGANADLDCADDCTELGDNNPFTDPTKFNGVHVRQKNQCSLLSTCLDNNTLSAEQGCMSGTIQEEKDQCAGWDWNDSPDSLCNSAYNFTPSWTVCDGTWAAEWKGYINLTGPGQHCFAVTGSGFGGCASLFFNTETNGLQSGAGARCYNVPAGVYPILWHYTMNIASTTGLHVQYCFGGTATCTPSAAIPASMLRPTYP